MKIVKELEINGKTVTYEQLKSEMEKHGVKATKFVDREPASLPTSGTFDRFEPAGRWKANNHHDSVAGADAEQGLSPSEAECFLRTD